MAEFGWADFIRQNQQVRSAVRKSFSMTADRLARIREYEKTKRIKYPEMKEAFDYVHALYPAVNVKQAYIYHTPQHFLREVGYGGVGGFYDTYAKVVVVTDDFSGGEYDEFKISAISTTDEVLCHELIHYCANFRLATASRNVEEEIAYGKSIGYLRFKGRTDEFIIEKNMLPYLMSVIDRAAVYRKVLVKHFDEKLLAAASIDTINKLLGPLQDEIFRESKAAACAIGEKMMMAYGGREAVYKAPTKRKLLLDDDVDV